MSSDHTQHILHTPASSKGRPDKTWCGAEVWRFDMAFLSVDHAAHNGEKQGRLVACKGCADAVSKALRNGQEEPTRRSRPLTADDFPPHLD